MGKSERKENWLGKVEVCLTMPKGSIRKEAVYQLNKFLTEINSEIGHKIILTWNSLSQRPEKEGGE